MPNDVIGATDALLDEIEGLEGVVQLWRDPNVVDVETGEVTRRWVGMAHRRGGAPWVRKRFYGDSRVEVLTGIRDALRRDEREERP